MISPPFNFKEIKPGEFLYLTRRRLEDGEGRERGEILVWRRRGDAEHSFIMECPYCQGETRGEVLLKRRPYRVRCGRCNRSITLRKLKDEV